MATIDSSLGKGPVAGLEKPPVLGREQEVEPDYSPETQELVGKMTNGIEKSEALAAGLGRVAKEGIFLSGPERDAIYAREEVGKTGLGVFDVGAFEQAGRGLQIKNRILEWLGSRSEYALTGKQGLVDTRKLKSSEAGKEQLMSDLELRAVALELGLKPEEAAESELKKTYAEGRRGAEKVITRKATEKEAETAAAGILEKRLKELETDTGAKLVKDREGLEVFKKEKADNASILEAADVAKLEEEAQSRESLIEERKRDLDSELKIIRSPLLEQQRGLEESLGGFSELLTDVTAQETAYRTQIKGLEDKIRKIKGTKQIGELLGDRVKEWEEEKAQVEVNLKDFRENKAKLEKRVAALKANKAQVDSTLQRINNIGKTPTELRAEREAKVAEERRQREQKTTAQQTQGQPLAKKRAGGEEAGEAAAGVSEVVDDGGDSDDWADTGEKFRQAVRPGGDLSNYRESARGKRPRPVAPVAERRVPRREQTEGRGAEGGEIVRPTRYWLNVLFDGRIENPRAKRIMEKHFRLGDVLKMSDDMTPAQVIDAYAGYLVEFEGLKLKYALLETKKKVTGIVEHIDEYDSGQRELDAADFRLSQPTAGSAQASEGVVKAPPAGREQAKAVAQPEGQGGPAAGGEEGMVELEQALNKSGQGEGKPADKPAGTATEVGGTSKAESGGKPSTNSVIEAFGRAGATAVQGKTEGGDGEQVKKK